MINKIYNDLIYTILKEIYENKYLNNHEKQYSIF